MIHDRSGVYKCQHAFKDDVKKILLIMIFEYGKDFQTYTVKFKAIIMLLFSIETLPKVLLGLLSDSH